MSKIEWTEKTWNPVTGCTKVSEACQNCYAEVMERRLQKMPGSAEKYRSKKLTEDIYIDDHCLGIPLKFEPERNSRPFVDWDKVEQILEMMNVLPPTRTVYRKELEPPMQYK